jgi:hypothetical protein
VWIALTRTRTHWPPGVAKVFEGTAPHWLHMVPSRLDYM